MHLTEAPPSTLRKVPAHLAQVCKPCKQGANARVGCSCFAHSGDSMYLQPQGGAPPLPGVSGTGSGLRPQVGLAAELVTAKHITCSTGGHTFTGSAGKRTKHPRLTRLLVETSVMLTTAQRPSWLWMTCRWKVRGALDRMPGDGVHCSSVSLHSKTPHEQLLWQHVTDACVRLQAAWHLASRTFPSVCCTVRWLEHSGQAPHKT